MQQHPASEEELTLTPVADWTVGELLKLPSGFVVKAYRPSMMTMISNGIFPNELLATARTLVEGQLPESGFDAAEFQKLTETFDILIEQCIIDPKIFRGDPKNCPAGQLPVAVIPDEDKQFIISWQQGGISFLQKFRRQQATLAEVGSDSAKVQPASEPASGDS